MLDKPLILAGNFGESRCNRKLLQRINTISYVGSLNFTQRRGHRTGMCLYYSYVDLACDIMKCSSPG